MSTASDVAIIGLDAAGMTLALFLAQQGWNTVLVGCSQQTAERARHVWSGPATWDLLQQAEFTVEAPLKSCPSEVCFYNADFTKSVTPTIPSERPHIVWMPQLMQAFEDVLLRRDHVEVLRASPVRRVSIEESGACLELTDQGLVRADLVVMASDDRRLLEQSNLATAAGQQVGLWTADYCCNNERSADDRMDFVLGVGTQGRGVGYLISQGQHTTVGISLGESAPKAISELVRISRQFAKMGSIPADWQSQAAGTSAYWSPAGRALEMDKHVAKRALAIGKAGGFVACLTNDALWPGIWSGQLAARTIHDALSSGHIQDKLRDFEQSWRTTMVDYLRMPNTDMPSLLPLVFTNKQMAARMLGALLLGVNF